MSPRRHLVLITFFTGNIQGGLGPFLATWLAQTRSWGPESIGWLNTLVGLGGLALSGPAGALVDRLKLPRLLLALACGAILAGTMLLLVAHGFLGVLAAHGMATIGGILVLPAVTAFTLGIVGKKDFPRQHGRNEAFNHAGILFSALMIVGGATLIGPDIALFVMAAMALGAIVAVAVAPGKAWSAARASGEEDADDEAETGKAGEKQEGSEDQVSPLKAVLTDRRLLTLAVVLALFSLGNGAMLSLVGQRVAAAGGSATAWTAGYVMAAQLTMIPVALWGGAWAEKHGGRPLMLVACAALGARALLAAWITDPLWLVPVQVLDGIASGLIGVAVPVVVADASWGSGRTQTALGAVYSVQGLGGQLSHVVGGTLVAWVGWHAAFLALALPVGGALLLSLGLGGHGRQGAEGEESTAQPA
ncbi:MFS transporter [Teichococcus oryzae]|uniref:MFS transporter n=1 Tax=Teichococcus oryzae TaxID=1608942 RepID=UPI0019D4F46F|nr:MFS transporter [Pseudoroseomonas oryzae]